MAKLLDQLLVIDVESTCWPGAPPAGQISEIIEIGLCVVDVGKLERIDRRSLLVRPVRSQISDFCTQLTTLKDEDFAAAGTLADAARILKREYCSSERLFASWGDYDRRQFERVCQELSVPYPFGTTHLNVKNLFSIAHGLPGELGMGAACRHVGLTPEGTHHRGIDDAWNIAGLLCGLLARARTPHNPVTAASRAF